MIRRLFDFAAGMSLFLWIAVTVFRAALPVGGFVMARYGANDARLLRAGGPGYPDLLMYQSLHDPTGRVVPLLDGPPRTSPLTFIYENHVGGGQSLRSLGLWAYWGRYNHPNGPFDFLVVAMDHGAFQLFTSLLPLLWMALWTMRRRVAQRRALRGVCRHCSYDLTGNTSGVCPECGTPVAQKAEAHA